MESIGSNSEDFRSVIDDLTVENKKLKQKLREYSKGRRPWTEDDKLFEIRVYGLSASKKRELEDTLREFASIISEAPEKLPTIQVEEPSTKPPDHPQLWNKQISNSTSCSRPVDSTYASMSASGHTSTSHLRWPPTTRLPQPKQVIKKDIKAYLHDIPAGLLPRQSPVMTEKAKTKLVVRKLEQLFLGRDSNSTRDSQSLQQQEISQSAAEAERSANEAKGHRVDAEGTREACIIPVDAEMLGNPLSETSAFTSSGGYSVGTSSKPTYLKKSDDIIPDQRPTRPLDLDPCRAQVPTENIAYIRHLGLPSPKLNSPSPDEGWLYLNLLISMAQLHTINVTADFVRKAVARVSRKFELSKDGQKIRWRGVTQGTSMSSDSGSVLEPGDDAMVDLASRSVNPRYDAGQYRDVKLQTRSWSENQTQNSPDNCSPACFGASSTRTPICLGQHCPNNQFDYEPLFFHDRARSEEEDHRCVPDGESLISSCPLEISTMHGLEWDTFWDSCFGPENSAIRKGKEGPIIFYNGAKFFTDLSGDSGAASCQVTEFITDCNVLGFATVPTAKSDLGSRENEGLIPEQSFPEDSENYPEVLDWPAFDSMNYNNKHLGKVYPGQVTALFQASGVGGVCPDDHFIIHVETRYLTCPVPQMSQLSLGKRMMCLPLHRFPQDFNSSLSCAKLSETKLNAMRVQSDLVSITTVVLPPSSLPPPSYVRLPFPSLESDNGENALFEFNSGCNTTFTHSRHSNQSILSALHYCSPHLVSESSYTASVEASEDSSIDLLAHARELDPDTIAAQEREFESNIIQMSDFVERAPMGSSIALPDEESELWSQISSSLMSSVNEEVENSNETGVKRGRSEDGVCRNSKMRRLV